MTPVYLFSWPSSAGIASYSYDLQSAGAAAGPLAEFVGHVAAANGADQVSILAFDLGAEPALAALERLPSSVQVRELVLVAPDLPVAGFAERMARVMPRAAHVTIYATEGTRALDVARRFYGGAARAGEARSDTVPLLPGVETILVPALRPPASPQHDAVVMGDIAALLATGARAAQRGGRQQTARGKNPGIYWQLAGQR